VYCADVIEQRGLTPMFDLLESLGGWPVLDGAWNESKFDWTALLAKLRLTNNRILINQFVGPDIKESTVNVIQVNGKQVLSYRFAVYHIGGGG